MLRELRDNTPIVVPLPGDPLTPTDPPNPPAPGKPDKPDNTRPWIRISLVAGAVVLLAAGITTAIALNRSPSPNSPVAARPAVVVNQRAADPCGLTSAAVLAGYGDAETDPHYANFNRCDVIVQSNSYTVDLRTIFQDTGGPAPTQPGAVTQNGSVGIEQPQSSPGSCIRTLLLADSTVILVDAEQQDGNGTPNLCAMTQAITQYAVGVINHSGVPQRKQPFDPTSLANANACGLLTATDLAAVPGIGAAQPQLSFGDWQCDWGGGSGQTHVGLRFDQSQPLSSSDGQEVPIGNRAAFVVLDDGGCEADLVDRTYTIPAGGQISELVNIEVDGTQPQSQQCDMAKQLAADVLPRLPS
jgi:eukaryotic-like serine/threonine-protein kinase